MISSRPNSSVIMAIVTALLLLPVLGLSPRSEAEERFSCPRGQILRVSTHLCVPKGTNVWLLAPSERGHASLAIRARQSRKPLTSISHNSPKRSGLVKQPVTAESRKPAKPKPLQLQERARLADPTEQGMSDEVTGSGIAPSEREASTPHAADRQRSKSIAPSPHSSLKHSELSKGPIASEMIKPPESKAPHLQANSGVADPKEREPKNELTGSGADSQTKALQSPRDQSDSTASISPREGEDASFGTTDLNTAPDGKLGIGERIFRLLKATKVSDSEPHPIPSEVVALEPWLKGYFYVMRSEQQIDLLNASREQTATLKY